jgi:hypothetical protein
MEQLYAGFPGNLLHELLLQIVWRMLNQGLLVSIKLNQHTVRNSAHGQFPVQFHNSRKSLQQFFFSCNEFGLRSISLVSKLAASASVPGNKRRVPINISTVGRQSIYLWLLEWVLKLKVTAFFSRTQLVLK